jgi:hypothetical protein
VGQEDVFFRVLKRIFSACEFDQPATLDDGSLKVACDGFILTYRIDEEQRTFSIIEVKPILTSGKRCGISLLRTIANHCEKHGLQPEFSSQALEVAMKLLPTAVPENQRQTTAALH